MSKTKLTNIQSDSSINDIILFKSKYPYVTYILPICITSVFVFLILSKLNILMCFMYCLIIGFILYYYFARNICIIKLYENQIIIKYLFPYKLKLISFDKILELDYYKNGYNFFSTRQSNNLVFKPHDTLTLKYLANREIEEVILYLNLRVFEFTKLLHELNKLVKQQKGV